MEIDFSTAWGSLLSTVFYLVAALLLLMFSFKVTDILTPGKLADEVLEKKNTSLALVTVGSWIGDAFIIAAVIGGSGAVHDSSLFHVAGNANVNLWINTLIWGGIGILVKAIFFKLFFRTRFTEQLASGNVALGALTGGAFLALGSIVAGVVGG